MHQPDIEKLRRFSLASGLALITYFAAIVKPSSAVAFSIFGITFNILNPKYISVGFVLASIYGLIRYVLYGMIIERSPSKTRKYMLSDKLVDNAYEIKVASKDDVDGVLKRLEYAFPSISKYDGGVEVKQLINPDFNRNGPAVTYCIRYKPNNKAKVLAVFHDIDYSAPIWVNLVGLFIAGYRLFTA